jgi:dTDP-4-amino-4,6-dideoxygalactose transaminase
MCVTRFDDYLGRLGRGFYLYANASNAFKDFLVWLARSGAHEMPAIAMPSYIPAKLYRAALAAGYSVRFYEVRDGCRFDLEDVERRIDAKTVAIFYVHYFGFSDGIKKMQELARRRAVALIEDCALSVGASYQGQELGTFGDVALFSMRKMFLYPEGGALVAGDRFRDFRPRYERRVSSCYSVPRYLLQRAKHAYVRVTRGADPLRLVHAGPPGYMDGQAQQTLSVKMLSPFTEYRLRHVNVDRVVERRRKNYRYVVDRFPDSPALDPIHSSLPEGCTPYSFPLLVRGGHRDELRSALVRDGILAGAGWPESPFDPALAGTRLLAQSLLELPIHQAVTRQQLDRTLRCLERVSEAASAVS